MLEIQTKISEAELPAALEALNPWIQVHRSGYASIKGYVAMQAGGDGTLNPKSGFHTGMRKALVIHRIREVREGADPNSIEGLQPVGASIPSALVPPTAPLASDHLGATQAPPDSLLSTESKAPSQKSQVPGPNGVHRGPEAQEPPAPTSEDLAEVESVKALFKSIALDSVNPAPWLIERLILASRAQSWDVVKRAAGAYVTGPYKGAASPSFKDFIDNHLAKALVQACQHPEDLKIWWVDKADRWPKGLQVRRWRCGTKGCRSHGDGQSFPTKHDHNLLPKTGKAWLLDSTGEKGREVDHWQECDQCGWQTDQDSGSGQVAA